MTTQKKPVIRASNSNIAGVIVEPNNRKNHSADFHGRYTFIVRVSVVPEVADKSYVGIISAVAASQDEAIRSIDNALKEGFCEADAFELRRFQPFGQDSSTGLNAFVLYRGSTTVDEFFDTFLNRSNRPQISARPFMSEVYDVVNVAFARYATAA
jgi:hypothetical protein